MKVLIVDDEPAVRISLKRVLERRGHEVKEAADGLIGLQSWEEWDPDVVLLDVLMPGLSGPGVLQERRTRHESQRAKVLLMSAYSGDYDLEKARSLGADQFLAKPFADIFVVAQMIEELSHGT